MELLEHHFDAAFDAPDGIKKLRELILTLAMQGKLASHDPNDLPGSELLKGIEAEKKRLVKQGKLKEPKPLPLVSPEEVPYELPEGWEWVRLGDVVQILNGRAYKQSELLDKGTPVLRVGNLFTSKHWYYSDLYLEDHKYIVSGDLIYAWSASFGPFVWSGDRVIYHYHIWKIQFFNDSLPNKFFLYNYLLESTERIKRSGNGIAMIHMTKERMEHLPVPIPPVSEQLRIVTKIDELMARCDALEKLRSERDASRLVVHAGAIRRLLNLADADRHIQAREFLGDHFSELYTVRENVTELRKAILQLAVMGKLVPQDPDDPPARELLTQIEAEKRRFVREGKIRVPKPLPPIKPEEIPFSLPSGWQWIRVADVAQLITSGSRDWAKYYSSSGAIFVTMGNLSRGSYQLRMDTIRYVSPPKDSEGARTRLEEGDLLISITGDVGNLGLIPANFGEAYINQHTSLLRVMPACRNRYFAELLRSPLAKEQFDAPQRGIKNSFRLDDVGEMIIPLPPLPMQERIVAKIDQLMSTCDTLEQNIDAARDTQSALLNAMMAQYGDQRCA